MVPIVMVDVNYHEPKIYIYFLTCVIKNNTRHNVLLNVTQIYSSFNFYNLFDLIEILSHAGSVLISEEVDIWSL